jgi:hypothetical protein
METAALTQQIATAVSGLSFEPLYETIVSLIPTVLPVGIGLIGLKKGISFVFSTIRSF